jgi:oligoendopeptidase F
MIPEQTEIEERYLWNAPSVFESEEAWDAEAAALPEVVDALSRHQGRLSEGPEILLEALEQVEEALRRLGKLYSYAAMLSAVDTTDQAAQARSARATVLYSRLMGTIAFLEPEVIDLGQERLREWLEAEPRLAVYAHYVDTLFHRQAHVRSPEVEELLGRVMDPFSSVYRTHDLLQNADLSFEPARSSEGERVPITQGTIDSLLLDPDRELRRSAWQNYADAYLGLRNTLASNLTASVKQSVFLARARRYESALEATLHPNNIPPAVFHNLIDTYRKHLPVWHRYWRVRRKMLGYDTLHPWDIKAPLAGSKPSIPYEQAVEWISEAMMPLGQVYVDIMRRGCLEERWVDVYPTRGKQQGAFSGGSPDTYPFILMNYTNDLESMSTLAHELGHSMHSYFAWRSQPMLYTHYSMFVAEVASNFNQAMTRAHLLERESDSSFQIGLIEEAMSNFHRYFFIMPTLARFELELHEQVERGEGSTAEQMIELMAELFAEGYGGEVEVDRERVGITWAQFAHLYASFYPFQYATGISGAHALAAPILAGEPEAAEAYIDFLRAGGSDYPLNVLSRAGVDLATPAPVETTFGVLEGLVERLETLAG